MTFDVVFLGTGAAVPVPSRGTTSQFLDIHGHTYLIDAGEGVQLALRNSKRRFQKLKGIFISHMHGDHVLGLPGLLSTMSLLGRQEAIDIWGPQKLEAWLRHTWGSIQAHMSFEVNVHEWSPHEVQTLHEADHYRLRSIPVKHRIPCCGLRVEEHSLPWKLNGQKAQDAGLPFHVRQALKRGEPIGFEGRDLKPELWCTQPRKARSYVYSADTRPCESLRIAAQGATLLYHDATFKESDAERAKSTHHSTTTEAARLARQAEVETLMLGHLSLRYKNLDALREEALREHPNVVLAKDGLLWRL